MGAYAPLAFGDEVCDRVELDVPEVALEDEIAVVAKKDLQIPGVGSAEGFKLAAEHKLVTRGRTVARLDIQDVNFIVAKAIVKQGSILRLKGAAGCSIELVVIYDAKVESFGNALCKHTLQTEN
ncbi:hypothetical protein HK096_010364 [Nowakowskiella sp. JEL0078]|nr:hypothetical protein HK096_010364 [Nowakowskiella sp. JEL0078]